MIEERTPFGTRRVFDQDEAEAAFGALRDRIFDTSSRYVSFHEPEPIFRDDTWLRVLIRGGIYYSDHSYPPDEAWKKDEWLLEWVKDDPRDSLRFLFEILVEDGIHEIVHMSPYLPPGPFTGALTTAPTRTAVQSAFYLRGPSFAGIESRLLFDETARWGMFTDDDEFGILGGEPAFLERYIAREGGMEFIRRKADEYFRQTYDEWKIPTVPRAYELARWDNPPLPPGSDPGN